MPMDNASKFTLIAVAYSVDAIGQRVPYIQSTTGGDPEPAETTRDVYARRIESVTRDEWATAGQMGFQASFRITMFLYDYEGETIAEVNGKRYGIYRTYHSGPDEIELYLGEKAGVK